jgi:hypothetical protein
MIQRNLECLEVITMKEPIHHLGAHGETIFAITERQGVKVMPQICNDLLHVDTENLKHNKSLWFSLNRF